MNKPVALSSFLAVVLGAGVVLADPLPLPLLGGQPPAPVADPDRDGRAKAPARSPRGEDGPPRGDASPPRGDASPPRGENGPPRGDASPPRGAEGRSPSAGQPGPAATLPALAAPPPGAPAAPRREDREARRAAQQREVHAALGGRVVDDALRAELRRHAEVIARIDRVVDLARAASDEDARRRAEIVRGRENARHQAFLQGRR